MTSDVSHDHPDESEVFQAAVDAEGDEYLLAEAALLASPASRDVLEAALDHDDPIARLMAHVLLDAAESETQKLDAVEQYMRTAERWFAPTIIRTPPLRGVVSNLAQTFGGSLGEYLALRLMKVPATPTWRQQLTLAYLERHPAPAATDALLRYATATTTASELRAAVANVLRSSGDTQLAAKVAAERERLARSGGTLPTALGALS